MVTEAYTNVENIVKYFGTPTNPGAHMPFNFLMIIEVNKESNASRLRDVIQSWYDNMPEHGWANWVVSKIIIKLLVQVIQIFFHVLFIFSLVIMIIQDQQQDTDTF